MSQAFYAGFATSHPTFVGYIQDGKIYSSDVQGQQVVGVVSKTYDDLKADYDSIYARCQQYYDKLVELGEIKPELTGDALIKAQADQLARATALLNQMSEQQEHLLSVINSMKKSGPYQPEEEDDEFSADNPETSSGAVPAVANAHNRVQQSTRAVQKYKGRSASGDSRKTGAA